MATSLRLDIAIEANRHFLENDYGDLSLLSFLCCFELSSKINMGQFSVLSKKQSPEREFSKQL